MELTKQGYMDVVSMPVTRFYSFLKWKADLEKEKQKFINENISRGSKKK